MNFGTCALPSLSGYERTHPLTNLDLDAAMSKLPNAHQAGAYPSGDLRHPEPVSTGPHK